MTHQYQRHAGRSGICAALALAALFSWACADAPDDAGTTPRSTNAAAGDGAPAPGSPGTPGGTAPAGGATGKPIRGASDRIQGRIISLICYKQDPSATPEAATECAKAQIDQGGGALAILGTDNIVYLSDRDPKTNTAQLRGYLGHEVIADGIVLEEMPELAWPGVTIRKIQIKMIKKKDRPTPAVGQTNASPEKHGTGQHALPAPSKGP